MPLPCNKFGASSPFCQSVHDYKYSDWISNFNTLKMNLSIEKKNVNNSELIECRKYDEGVLKHGMQAK